ncbi:MAG: PhoX family protein, partial [Stackebrandtia sp.]
MSPRFLPLINPTGPHGSRSAMTCRYRCGDACSQPIPNKSDNEDMADVIGSVLRRRAVLKGGAAASVTLAVSGLLPSPAAATGIAAKPGIVPLAFSPVEPNVRDNVTVPVGYDYDVVIRWGDKVVAGAPPFNVYKQTAEAQAGQFGYNCDYIGVLPIKGTDDRAVMGVNHEYTNPELMFPTDRYDDETMIAIEMAAHGMSVLEIERGRLDGAWKPVRPADATRNRRIHAHTKMRLRGPAAGDERLRTAADPSGEAVLGMLNNCAGGMTPWGTFLTGEENFNQYFDASGDLDPAYTESYERYGVTGEDSRGWSAVDERFDLTTEPHEP